MMREAAPIVREKRARRFFESGQVPAIADMNRYCRFLRWRPESPLVLRALRWYNSQ
jgi:hypothetical protein